MSYEMFVGSTLAQHWNCTGRATQITIKFGRSIVDTYNVESTSVQHCCIANVEPTNISSDISPTRDYLQKTILSKLGHRWQPLLAQCSDLHSRVCYAIHSGK